MIDERGVLQVPVLREYMEAFRARNLSGCLGLYSEDAVLEFGGTFCRDRQCLERWHVERFTANMVVTKIDRLGINGDEITVEGAITSDRLQTWGAGDIQGRAKFVIRNGKIAEARFGLQ